MSILLINIMCFLLLISALMVVVSKNPVHSILFLVISFLASSFILFLLENEFLAFFFPYNLLRCDSHPIFICSYDVKH